MMCESSMKRAFFPILALALLGGCGQPEPDKQMTEETVTPASQVEQRALERWQALINGDTEQAYKYLSPGARSLMPLQVYQNLISGKAISWTGVDVDTVECESDVCNVKLTLNYKYTGAMEAMQGQESSSILTENWVLSGGKWWFVPK